MKEIIETIQSKRVNIEKDKMAGEITRVMLSSIEYKPRGEGYKNMGEMIKRLLDRKRGAEKYSATCGRMFSFQYRIVPMNDDVEVILIKKKEMY
jgi:hypothetical protein